MVKNSKWLVRLFLVCDKYQVAESFQDFFRLHIRLSDATVGVGQVESCIIAAFVGLEEEFSINCKSLTTETKDRVIAFCDKDLLALLPSGLLGKWNCAKIVIRTNSDRSHDSTAEASSR